MAKGTVGSSLTLYEEALSCLSSLIIRRTRADGLNKDDFDLMFDYMKVDVAILEVGLGGKFDATNVVKTPIVCGISSLGYDHMEILGNTLGQIAGEKAGIFKQDVQAYTVPQPEEAMSVLKETASRLGIPLQVVSPLDREFLNGQQLGLNGEHQYLNAGLASCNCPITDLASKTGHAESIVLNNTTSLPEQFVRGLTMADLPGRAHIVADPHVCTQNMNSGLGGLVFYLDGAHGPESLEVCARWFSNVIREETQSDQVPNESCKSKQILLFNCMSVRDPQLLLPPLVNTCAHHGIHFDKAVFVQNQSVYNKVSSHSTQQNDQQQVDVSWQLTLQRVWENLVHGEKGPGHRFFTPRGRCFEIDQEVMSMLAPTPFFSRLFTFTQKLERKF